MVVGIEFGIWRKKKEWRWCGVVVVVRNGDC